MKAIVRDIEVGTRKENKYYHDKFVEDMKELVGQTIDVARMYPGWYLGVYWSFHYSWLKFIKEKKWQTKFKNY